MTKKEFMIRATAMEQPEVLWEQCENLLKHRYEYSFRLYDERNKRNWHLLKKFHINFGISNKEWEKFEKQGKIFEEWLREARDLKKPLYDTDTIGKPSERDWENPEEPFPGIK